MIPAPPLLPLRLPATLLVRRAAWALGAALCLGIAACGRDVPPPPPSSAPPPEPEAAPGFGQNLAPGGELRVTPAELRAAVALVNARLPAAVDDVTRLDSIAVLDGRLVYRFTAALDRTLDPVQRTLMDSGLAVLARRACNTVLARRAFDAGFDLRYEYRRMNGTPEAAIDITRAGCGG